MLRSPRYPEQAPIAEYEAMNDPAWFVYLLALADCSAFKVGFSCNPLQRLHCFSCRYYERFDLTQSLLLRLGTESDARAIEATLKTELAECRTESPTWVPLAAGGHTEWFGAVHFGRAEERLRSFLDEIEHSGLHCAADYIRLDLERMSGSFEPWTWSQARLARCVSLLRSAAVHGRSCRAQLRDEHCPATRLIR